MKIGCHISIAGGIENAPERASILECETFQIFARSPRGRGADISRDQVKKFRDEMVRLNLEYFYIHAPYYINLASINKKIYHGSITALQRDLEDGSRLGARAMMTHIGSAKDVNEEQALELVSEGIEKILDGYEGTCQFLLEISAGSGAIIGARFEQIGEILKRVKNKNIGICFDTQHAFGSGYDIRDQKGLENTLKQFEKYIGIEKLVVSHVNDSKVELGSHKDRHEDLGKGYMGIKTFEYFIKHPKLEKLDFLLETPTGGENYIKEINFLKKRRGSKNGKKPYFQL